MDPRKRMILSMVLVFGIPFGLFLLILLFKPQNLFVWPFPFILFATNFNVFSVLLFLLPFILLMVVLSLLHPKGLPIFIHTYERSRKSDRCPQCGTYLRGWENYCPHCGFHLRENQERQFG